MENKFTKWLDNLINQKRENPSLKQTKYVTTKQVVEQNLQGLKDFIDDKEIYEFYIDLVTNMVKEYKDEYKSVPFVDEVEEFNHAMNKPNNYTPTIPEEKEWMFVYNFILEELEEYKEACEKGNIIEVLDAICDITYVSLGNATMLHGLKNYILEAYAEVQSSNMSKLCMSLDEAIKTVEIRSKEQGEPCHYEKIGEYYVVYRTSDNKVMKNINYHKPDLKQFFERY